MALSKLIAWEVIKSAFNNCEVEKAFQAHSREVKIELKNGQKINSVEPEIDDIMDLASGVQEKCGRIIIATE